MSQLLKLEPLYEKLLTTGVVECNSPKNRRQIYQRLQKAGYEFSREVIGDTGVSHMHWRKSTTAVKFIRWVESQRITKKSIEQACISAPGSCGDLSDYDYLFDPAVPFHVKCERIEPLIKERSWGVRNVIDWCWYRKTIVHITVARNNN